MSVTSETDCVDALVDDRLFDAFWVAVEHFGTTDLVVFFETERDVNPVSVAIRESLLKAANTPHFLREKLANKPMAASPTTFWLVVAFRDQVTVTAVTARRTGEGGSG